MGKVLRSNSIRIPDINLTVVESDFLARMRFLRHTFINKEGNLDVQANWRDPLALRGVANEEVQQK